ncbi:unnamed protein product [Caenorhabditis angaria]|uniref:Solute carrier family 40 member n=1 Tax=Caenorhabditis angaria TaxID=860376 RepID=A0A9P1IUV4_9PELO|nr:unnamed protein product [Caenorhabditis angaria]
MTAEKKSTFSKNSLFLYAAYISTCLEDRAWSFCISLCMQMLGGMRMVSIEQLFEGLLQIALSGHLGKLFDRLSRKTAILTVVPFNNLSIVGAAALLFACLSISDLNSWLFTVLLISAMCLCAINRLFLNAEKFIVGRDWVMVIGDNGLLSNMNATLTTLDQATNVIAPILTGALVTIFDLKTTVAIFGIGSLVSMASKTFFLRSLYMRNPELHFKETDDKAMILDEEDQDPPSRTRGVISTYYYQNTFPAAFGMTLLFMTVMGFDGLAVGYGSSAGLPDVILGAFRSYGSFAGILGAISYAFFEKQYSVATSGFIGLVVQQVFAVLAVVSIWMKGSPMDLSGYFGNFTIQLWWHDLVHSFDGANITTTQPHIDWHNFTSNGVSLDSIFMFLIAIASARYGLWCLDLAITHIMQVNIPENERNTVFGVHNAICNTFSVLKDLLVIILPLPSTFAICILISYAFVTSGHIFFIYYLVKSKTFSTIGRRLSKLNVETDADPEKTDVMERL